ncbi:hypothetical protein [Deinococcus sp. 6GRE01]|uniref:hypothetical protein n=1 Tax=Deinococcus sp. 6GRE01 TaxID=2745873 RepID=UPI001E3E286D|nr:hypothetical protein [Deinococcus sp. 6GRE01]MCD0156261.1 hypothetical protein [Deinococcus sp. 6GRE01]
MTDTTRIRRIMTALATHGHVPSIPELTAELQERGLHFRRQDIRDAHRATWEANPSWPRHPHDHTSTLPSRYRVEPSSYNTIDVRDHWTGEGVTVASFPRTHPQQAAAAQAEAARLEQRHQEQQARTAALTHLRQHLADLPTPTLLALSAGLQNGRALTTRTP